MRSLFLLILIMETHIIVLQTFEDSTMFYGNVTCENAERVKEILENTLEGKTYSFFSTNTIGKDLREHQHLTPQDATSGKAINLSYENDTAYFTIVDSYGVWSFYSVDTIFKAEENTIEIWQGNGGYPIHWKIVVEN